MNTNFKTYYVRSQRLAGFLMQKGFVLHSIKPNRDYPERNVFLFTNSEELIQSVEEYRKQKELKTNDNQ